MVSPDSLLPSPDSLHSAQKFVSPNRDSTAVSYKAGTRVGAPASGRHRPPRGGRNRNPTLPLRASERRLPAGIDRREAVEIATPPSLSTPRSAGFRPASTAERRSKSQPHPPSPRLGAPASGRHRPPRGGRNRDPQPPSPRYAFAPFAKGDRSCAAFGERQGDDHCTANPAYPPAWRAAGIVPVRQRDRGAVSVVRFTGPATPEVICRTSTHPAWFRGSRSGSRTASQENCSSDGAKRSETAMCGAQKRPAWRNCAAESRATKTPDGASAISGVRRSRLSSRTPCCGSTGSATDCWSGASCRTTSMC